MRREVLNCLNEKLLTDDDLPLINSQVLPGFTVYKLQEARKPVKRSPHFFNGNQGDKERQAVQPWWNQYPSFIRTKGMKLALEKVLHMF